MSATQRPTEQGTQERADPGDVTKPEGRPLCAACERQRLINHHATRITHEILHSYKTTHARIATNLDDTLEGTTGRAKQGEQQEPAPTERVYPSVDDIVIGASLEPASGLWGWAEERWTSWRDWMASRAGTFQGDGAP